MKLRTEFNIAKFYLGFLKFWRQTCFGYMLSSFQEYHISLLSLWKLRFFFVVGFFGDFSSGSHFLLLVEIFILIVVV